MAEEKKKLGGGVIAAICIAVVAAVAAIVAVVVINVTKNNLVGTYALSAIVDSEGNESADSLSMLKAFGMDYEIEFKDNKNGVLKVHVDSSKVGSLVESFSSAFTDGESTTSSEDVAASIPNETSIDFTYDGKKISLSNPISGSSLTEMDYEVKDGAVIINMSGQKMKFTKK